MTFGLQQLFQISLECRLCLNHRIEGFLHCGRQIICIDVLPLQFFLCHCCSPSALAAGFLERLPAIRRVRGSLTTGGSSSLSSCSSSSSSSSSFGSRGGVALATTVRIWSMRAAHFCSKRLCNSIG